MSFFLNISFCPIKKISGYATELEPLNQETFLVFVQLKKNIYAQLENFHCRLLYELKNNKLLITLKFQNNIKFHNFIKITSFDHIFEGLLGHNLARSFNNRANFIHRHHVVFIQVVASETWANLLIIETFEIFS